MLVLCMGEDQIMKVILEALWMLIMQGTWTKEGPKLVMSSL